MLGEGGALDRVVTAVFVAEVVVKVLANGLAPWRYWTGADRAWNNFDFAVVVFSFRAAAALVFGRGVGAIRLLRLFRLARLWKVRCFPGRLGSVPPSPLTPRQ